MPVYHDWMEVPTSFVTDDDIAHVFYRERGGFSVVSKSDAAKVYEVGINDEGEIYCTCPSGLTKWENAKYAKCCWHVKACAAIMLAVDWEFVEYVASQFRARMN